MPNPLGSILHPTERETMGHVYMTTGPVPDPPGAVPEYYIGRHHGHGPNRALESLYDKGHSKVEILSVHDTDAETDAGEAAAIAALQAIGVPLRNLVQGAGGYRHVTYFTASAGKTSPLTHPAIVVAGGRLTNHSVLTAEAFRSASLRTWACADSQLLNQLLNQSTVGARLITLATQHTVASDVELLGVTQIAGGVEFRTGVAQNMATVGHQLTVGSRRVSANMGLTYYAPTGPGRAAFLDAL